MAKTKQAQAKQSQAKNAQKGGAPAKPASKTNGQVKKQVTKQRGALLSTLLVIILVHGILGSILVYTSLKAEYANQRNWVILGLTLASLADAVAAAGMWYWKKWGIYLYVAATVVQAAIHLMLTGSMMVVFYDFIPVLILAYVINLQVKNHLFE